MHSEYFNASAFPATVAVVVGIEPIWATLTGSLPPEQATANIVAPSDIATSAVLQ